MEDEDDKESVEFSACNSEGETDEDAVKYDTELEDKYCGHLRFVVFKRKGVVYFFDVGVLAGMTQVIFAWSMCTARSRAHCCSWFNAWRSCFAPNRRDVIFM